MRFAMTVALMALAFPAAAKEVRVTNPLATPRADAVAEVAAPGPGDVWSVQTGGRVLPAQRVGNRVRFTLPLKAHETVKVELLPEAAPAAEKRVQVILNIQEGGTLEGDPANGGAIKGGTFHLRDRFVVPDDHFLHDGLIAFEGIGWESDRVAYRLYLDHRNVPDIFGKLGPGMIFQDVGHGFDDYQYPVPWGGDIFKVGGSLGMGGIGLLRDGKATQIGPAQITGHVAANGPVTAIAGVDADAIAGGVGSIHATYAITAGSPLTEVSVAAQGIDKPLVAGLTTHSGDQTFVSTPKAGAHWGYIAVWGPQEHGPDAVGTALFYRLGSVVGPAAGDGQTLFVQFISRTEASYVFGARWVQEGKNSTPGIADLTGFQSWLDLTVTELEQPVVVK